jgi:hypothetical protein
MRRRRPIPPRFARNDRVFFGKPAPVECQLQKNERRISERLRCRKFRLLPD